MSARKSVLSLFAAALVPTASFAELRITEVCAKCQPNLVAQKDLGWVRLVNDGEKSVNLRDYKIVVTNRGKKLKADEMSFLPDREVAAGGTTLVYTSEKFPNAKDATVVEYDYGGYGRIAVVPKKINPKSYPMVQLLKQGKKKAETIQTVFVPVDLADEKTYDAANRAIDGVPYGPNISCLYGVKDAADPWRAFPQAKAGADYEVRFPVNPIDMSEAEEDRIASVRLVFRVAMGEAVTNDAPMAAVETNGTDGVVYAGTIPGAALTAPGQLVQFAALITDGAGRVFRSPSFRNPDDGYEWYGTIVEPGDLDSPTLQTFHLFGTPEVSDTPGVGSQSVLMNIDSGNAAYFTPEHPYGARLGVYDSRTGLYHDNVRVDRRGNTSGAFRKLSHGLRFNKAQPLVLSNEFTEAEIECRKSSFVSEYQDPSLVRQSLSFKVFRDMGLKTPFHYPVRVNLNGAFYQLAFHSERFTDELIEDHYELDPLGYSYKNVGYMEYLNTHAGEIEKKTPDDGNEKDLSVLAAFFQTIRGADGVTSTYTGDGMDSEIPSLTKTVVQTFDLPAWINYLAAARITQETDDYKANVSLYYDANGTGTWMPLCYDLQLSWGQYWSTKAGTIAAQDAWPSHPFYGGRRCGGGNLGFESVWQSPKFRRLYLRRLRSVMDQVLKAPGTPREETPFWDYVVAVTNAARAEAEIDQALWKPRTYAVGQPMYPWSKWLSVEEAEDDLWSNFVEPHRAHFYNTHSATNAEKAIGYGANLNAGIPLSQAPTAELKAGLSVVVNDDGSVARDGVLVIRNDNDAAVDMSGWKLSKAVKWTLPAGTVVDAHDVITIVADRRRYIELHGLALTDEVIVGNAEFKDVARNPVVLKDADDVKVIETYPPPVVELGEVTATPGTDYLGSRVVVALGEGFAENNRKVTATLEIEGCETAMKGKVDLKAGTIAFAADDVGTLPAAAVRAGKVTVTVGDVVNTCAVVFEQGTVTRTPSAGWICETADRIGGTGTWSVAPEVQGDALYLEDGSVFTPTDVMPDSAVSMLRFHGAIGGTPDGDFDADAHAGVKIVETPFGDRYAFKTSGGIETNMLVAAERGDEVNVEVRLDYRLGQATYVIDGTAFGPYGISASRTVGLSFTGCGSFASLTGEYETRALDTNLAKVGGAEYATVAAAADAGRDVELLWDASWAPTKNGEWSFRTNGHRLDLGDAKAKVVEAEDGILSVSVWISGFLLMLK